MKSFTHDTNWLGIAITTVYIILTKMSMGFQSLVPFKSSYFISAAQLFFHECLLLKTG